MIRALGSWEELGRAVGVLQEEGCGYHVDALKNWDLAQISALLRGLEKSARILDIGCAHSETSVLRFCHKKGFTRPVGIDLVVPVDDRLMQMYLMFKRRTIRPPYALMKRDATRTRFRSNLFDLITCVSVIEHGVDSEAFFGEVARILKPRGTLYVSTDYWEPKVVSDDVRPLGLKWNIYSRREVEELIAVARKYDLHSEVQEVPPTEEQPVHWMGRRYTFLSLVFEKGPLGSSGGAG